MTSIPPTVQAESLDDYALQYRVHWDLVRAHLIGKSEDSRPLLPSFFPPASFWTASEKDLFFHGLSVFSRLRPDLIAEHIRTKSTFDVCLYLDALHTGYLKECSGTSVRDELEPAMDMSEEWIEHEEMLSSALASDDTYSSDVDRSQLDLSQPPSPDAFPNDDLETNSHESTILQEKRDEFLSHLDSTCLTVMERLIREAEQDAIMEDGIPSLAAGSRALDIGLQDRSPAANSNNQSLDSDLSDAGNANTFEQSELQRRLKKRLYMRRRRAQAAGKTFISDAIKLRPGRPKRPQKPTKPRPRTYKTKNKKHAIPNSNSETLDELEDDSDHTPARSVSEPMGEDAEYGSRTQGGITKPYRIRNLCLQNGLDGQTLVGMDLNFFHLSTIGRLLRLYNSLDESPRDLGAVSISANSLRILISITTEFVSEVIHRAIITKEQEIRLKRSLKVWTYDRDEINGENVKECLNSMGLGKLSKDAHLSRILGQDADKETTGSRSPADEMQLSSGTLINAEQSSTPQEATSHPAQFVLPESLLWCSLPSFSRFFPSDDIVSQDIDEEELKHELTHENKLDREDRRRSKKFEALLWGSDPTKKA